jgi:hypothetical protein
MNLSSGGHDPYTLFDQLGLCLDEEGLFFRDLIGLADHFEYTTEIALTLPDTSIEKPLIQSRERYIRFYDNIRRHFPDQYAIALVGHKGNDIGDWKWWCTVALAPDEVCPTDKVATNGHFVVIAGLTKSEYWDKGPGWQWVKIYDPLDNQVEYHTAKKFVTYLEDRTWEVMFVGEKEEE